MNPARISKFLSLVLRHEPGKIGILLDPNGWVDCETLIAAANRHGVPMDRPVLDEIVRTSDKQRFAFDAAGTRIRANQGHSVEVDLNLDPMVPPAILYHGTVDRFLDSIRVQGLIKGDRHHVHLSAERQTAIKVGERRGKPMILTIRAGDMHSAGHVFFMSANGVWLTGHVPPRFIGFPEKSNEITALYRPVGPEELKLIEDSGWTAFPPRLPEQPVFYPVTNEEYAIQIARDWNVPASGSGYVTRFEVDTDYLKRFPIQTVGGREHTELWVPAEELDEFNRHIVGRIEVTKSFP